MYVAIIKIQITINMGCMYVAVIQFIGNVTSAYK